MEKKIIIEVHENGTMSMKCTNVSFIETQGLLDFWKRKNFIEKLQRDEGDDKLQQMKKFHETFESLGKGQSFTATYKVPVAKKKIAPKKKHAVQKKKK